ncbi:hypothetical protein HYH03_009554 [Edaphochlamys debaryana]|uniref:FAS1 domain-containing protein n=1 Tax=Edaphochlamys debaryana TaxID=47281 RepID=A0A836BWU7_9CHLO|nr:hypothetical protein HYH03_009554 [Edaphochlamys debaryana]|eukprot:KAG2492056.1 hypothetical protein HYH03_009554 [Edaphochlamys debaryana]
MARRGVLRSCGVLVAGVLLALACRPSAATILTTISSNPDLVLFANALQLSGAADLFNVSETQNLTVFAPSNAAFLSALAALKLSQNDLVQNAGSMYPILLYHVLVGATDAEEFSTNLTSRATRLTSGTTTLTVNVQRTGTAVRVESLGTDANVTTANIAAGDSVIHIIDNVLVPFYPTIYSSIIRQSFFTRLATAAQISGVRLVSKLTDPLTAWTMFTPINVAFTGYLSTFGLNFTDISQLAAFPAKVRATLNYHIIPSLATGPFTSANFSAAPGSGLSLRTLTGQNITITKVGTTYYAIGPSNNATITLLDSPAGFTNAATYRSAIHWVNRVLLPPPLGSLSAALAARNDVTRIVGAINNETTYSSALTDPNFSGTLLVPTDAAWNNLLASMNTTWEVFLSNKTRVKKILELHIIPSVGIPLEVDTLVNNTLLATKIGANTLSVFKPNDAVTMFVAINGGKGNATVLYKEMILDTELATVMFIDAVLIPGDISTAPIGTDGSNPGAASTASPSFVLLLWSALAAALLYVFGSS